MFCMSSLNFVFSYFFAALDDVPFVISEKFCENPQKVKIRDKLKDKMTKYCFITNNMGHGNYFTVP